jgi:hypothetical protein
MQSIRLNRFPLLPTLACGLLLLAVGNAWAETPGNGSQPTPASYIEGWDVEEDENSSKDNWTWFGMGYEHRTHGNQGSTAGGGSAGGAGAAGAGGPAAAMNQRGPGRR